jgi:cellulose synthase/poly-beta-1,6-N-acetylglucosamine synthase-like glycosyltransferase
VDAKILVSTLDDVTLPAQLKTVKLIDVTRCTVAVFAHNEQRTIAKTILSIIRQNLSPSIEIAELLVVVSGCTDRTLEIVRSLARSYGSLTIIEERRRSGKAHAVNLILQRSIGTIIFLVPGDVVLEPNAINELCSTLLKDSSIGVACGRACPVNSPERAADRIGLLLWDLHNRTLQSLTKENLSTHACGEFMALKRSVIQHIDEDMINDDAYIGVLAWSRGFRVSYNDNAKVWMKAPSSISEIIRQRTRVLIGHQVVKRRLGHFPRTLSFMMLYDQKRVIRILTMQMREKPSQWFTLSLACYLEVLANILALFAHFSRVDFRKWRAIESTKDTEIPGECAEFKPLLSRFDDRAG